MTADALWDFFKWASPLLFGAVFVFIWRLRAEDKTENERTRERTYKRLDEAHDELNGMRTQMAAWNLEIVRTYATKAELERVEARIMAGFERLEMKLDRIYALKEGS